MRKNSSKPVTMNVKRSSASYQGVSQHAMPKIKIGGAQSLDEALMFMSQEFVRRKIVPTTRDFIRAMAEKPGFKFAEASIRNRLWALKKVGILKSYPRDGGYQYLMPA